MSRRGERENSFRENVYGKLVVVSRKSARGIYYWDVINKAGYSIASGETKSLSVAKKEAMRTAHSVGGDLGRFSSIGLHGETEQRELELYVDNDQPLYQKKMAMYLNLARKVAQGKYDRKLAPKLLRYLTDEAARRYVKEFDAPGARPFSVADRQVVAGSLAREFETLALSCVDSHSGYGCNDIGDAAATVLRKTSRSEARRQLARW